MDPNTQEPDSPDKQKQNPQDVQRDIVKSIFEEQTKDKSLSSVFQSTNPSRNDREYPHALKEVDSQKAKSDQDKNLSVHNVSLFLKIKKLFQKTNPIGIDIGSHSVKIAQVCLGDKGPKLTQLFIYDLPKDMHTGQTQPEPLLREFLSDILKKHNIQGDVYSALPARLVQYQHIILPQMPFKEIKSAVQWEIKHKAGAKSQELAFDYALLNGEQMPKNEKIELIGVTVPEKDVIEHMDFLESAGLKPVAIEPESFSLLACLNFNNSISSKEVVIVLDFGGGSTRLTIIRNKNFHFSRLLNISGEGLTSAIQEYCRISSAEAETLKRTCQVSNHEMTTEQPTYLSTADAQKSPEEALTPSTRIKHAVSIILEKLVSDIERTFKYYSYQLTKSEVTRFDKIILCGGSANFNLLKPFLEQRLGVPVKIENPLARFEIAEQILTQQTDLDKTAVQFCVAIGLALRAIE